MGLDDRGWRFNFQQEQDIFLLSTASKSVVKPIQPLSQRYQGLFAMGKMLKVTIYLHLVKRLRMRGAISQSPSSMAWCSVNHKENLGLECLSAMYVKILVFRDVLEQTARFYISVESSTLKMVVAG